jgi:glycosyltransferase involved in cell wall biosynthesis
MDDEREGFVLDTPDDLDRMAEALHALRDADVRRRMGAAAREVVQQHTIERNVREMTAVFETAAARKETLGR